MVAAFAMVAAISCTKEIDNISTVKPEEPVETIVFNASFDAETKAKLNDMKSEWVANDAISIFDGKNGYQFTAASSGVSSEFTYTGSGFNKNNNYIGVYPYNINNDASTSSMFAYGYIPTQQTVTKDSYDPKAALSVAYSVDQNLSFKNAHALLKFNVTDQNAQGITFSGNNNEIISGLVCTKLKNTGEIESISLKDGHLYLKPNSNWKKDNARFSAYFFGNGEIWVDMKDPDNDGVYQVLIPTDKQYPNVIFCRMNPSAIANNWNNKWNQTSDLKVPSDGKICYTVAEGAWDKGDGTWEERNAHYTYAELNGTLSAGTYYIAVAPQTFSKGFKVELHFGADKKIVKTISTNFTIESNKIYNMGCLDYKLYLKPNDNWKVDNARFAVYLFGNGDKWINMTDADGDGIYEVTIPADKWYKNVIFCRMNPSASANNWNNKWNQTGDLVIPTDGNNHYTVKEGTWGEAGTWSKK